MVAKSVEETLAEWDTDGCTLRADSSIPIEPGSVLILRVWPSGEIGVGDSVYAPRPATCGMTDEELARAIAAALTDTDLVVVNEAVDHSPFYARDAMQTLKRRGRLQSLAEWFLNGVEPEDQRPIMFTAEHDSDASAEDESVADSERQSELFHTASDFGVRVMEDERTPSMRRKKSPACNIDESPLRLVAVLLDVAVDTEARTVVKVAKRRSVKNIMPTKIIVQVGAVVVQNDDEDRTLTVEGSARSLFELEVDIPEFERDANDGLLPLSRTADGCDFSLTWFLYRVLKGALEKEAALVRTIGTKSRWYIRKGVEKKVLAHMAVCTSDVLKQTLLIQQKRSWQKADSDKTSVTILLSAGKLASGDEAPTLAYVNAQLEKLRNDDESVIICSQGESREQKATVHSPARPSLSRKAEARATRSDVEIADMHLMHLYKNNHTTNAYFHSFDKNFLSIMKDHLCQTEEGKNALRGLPRNAFSHGTVVLPQGFFPASFEAPGWKDRFPANTPHRPGERSSCPPGTDSRPPKPAVTAPPPLSSPLERIAAAVEARVASRVELCRMTFFKRDPHGRHGIETRPQETIYQHLQRLKDDDPVSYGWLLEVPESENDELSYEVQLSDDGSRTITQNNLYKVTLASLINDANVTTPLTVTIVAQTKKPAVCRRAAL